MTPARAVRGFILFATAALLIGLGAMTARATDADYSQRRADTKAAAHKTIKAHKARIEKPEAESPSASTRYLPEASHSGGY
jgi:hypothetical protein